MFAARWLTAWILIAACALADDKRPLKEILDDLKSGEPELRLRGTSDLASYPKQAAKPCLDLLQKEEVEEVRRAAVATLIGAEQAVVAKIVEEAMQEEGVRDLFFLDVLDVFDANPSKECMRTAAKLHLWTLKQEIETKAKDVLMKHKKAAVAGLAASIFNTKPEGQARGVRTLQEMGTKDSVRLLIAIGCRHGDFGDDVDQVHLSCREYLTRLGRPAVPFLIEALGKELTRNWSCCVLRDSTGKGYGPTQVEKWKAWWKENRQDGDDLPEE